MGLARAADVERVMRRIRATDKNLSVSKASDYNASEQWIGYMQGFA